MNSTFSDEMFRVRYPRNVKVGWVGRQVNKEQTSKQTKVPASYKGKLSNF